MGLTDNQHFNKAPRFPKVDHKCGICDGTGLEDVSYHGSPQYEKCCACGGDVSRVFTREMTVDEKLDYLLLLLKDKLEEV